MTQTEPLTKLNGEPLRSQRPIDYAVNKEHKLALANATANGLTETEVNDWLWEALAQALTTVKLQQQLVDKLLAEAPR